MKAHLLPSAFLATAFAAFLVNGAELKPLKITAASIAGNRDMESMTASGGVKAVSLPFRLFSELVEKRANQYDFAAPTAITTCTNECGSLHWLAHAGLTYREGESIELRHMVTELFGLPIMYFPYVYYPLDTDYGWRVMPGYTSRWGAYLLTRYVYHLAGDMSEGHYGLRGSTRLDLRSKNGVALGESLRWSLGDFGRGKFKVYYAWDQDHDRYDRHWQDNRRWNYQNWSSTVPQERYALDFSHVWHPTERDLVRAQVAYYSDSYFIRDFMRNSLFGSAQRYAVPTGNSIWWEHLENSFGFGVVASGSLNDFYGGVRQLPEAYLEVMPQPLLWGVEYESQTRCGFMDRQYARLGKKTTNPIFRYVPGEWADYDAFRVDSYHRLSRAFKFGDVLSVVPRIGGRGTYWSEAGVANQNGLGVTRKTDSDVMRYIVEGGVTFSARGRADFDNGFRHIVEPYFDVTAQKAKYDSLTRRSRPYVFDSVELSRDWLDQFAGRSRNLPYSYFGVTPGVRNTWRKTDESGLSRTVLDLDVYAAIQFNDTEYLPSVNYGRSVVDIADPNYGEDQLMVAPGVRAVFLPSATDRLMLRAEADMRKSRLAYAFIDWEHRFTKTFAARAAWISRDQRYWDFSTMPYDNRILTDDFNHIEYSLLELSFEHELCDAVAWSPYVSFDLKESEIEEVGAWVDLRTDCLGFRFSLSYETDFVRIDKSETDDDWRFGFFIYLRAFGPGNGFSLGR